MLVVAHRTAAAPPLIEAVRERARRNPCEFFLLVPQAPRAADPDGEETERTLELALPLLEEAAGSRVTGAVGDPDPVVAVRKSGGADGFDEVILSTLPPRISRWLRRDVPRRLEELGVRVSVVTAPQADRPRWGEAPPHFGRG